MNLGYFSPHRNLTRTEFWKKTPHLQRSIFITLLDYIRYSPEEFDDYGVKIQVAPGELCISYQELADLCGMGCTKKQVSNFVDRFVLRNILGRRKGHKRVVLSIIHKETYEVIKKQFGTTDGTILGRSWDDIKVIKKKGKKDKDSTSNEVIAPTPQSGPKLIFNFVNKSFENITEADIQLWKTAYPHADIHKELAAMSAWLIANSGSKGRKKNFNAFIQRWLTRADAKAEMKKAFDKRAPEKKPEKRIESAFHYTGAGELEECHKPMLG